MASPKEIKKKAAGIKKIQKITDAMQKVAVSKMHQAQQHMATSMPYAAKIAEVVSYVANIDSEEHNNLWLQEHNQLENVGYIVISTDRGLCGGLNTNLFRITLEHAQQFKNKNIETKWCLFGEKARGFFNSLSDKIIAHVTNLGETPKLENLVATIGLMLNAYKNNKLDRLFVAHNEFINTMTQKPKITQLLPLKKVNPHSKRHKWDYIYEPEPHSLLNTLIVRFIEAQVYQAIVDNLACEQVARMLAMKNATKNAKDLIDNLQLMYNKARQESITQEISEIISGAETLQN